ncbi:hypothetical protein [Moraxella bovoculi]|uniref:hypothetical protein n=1 Tax=Moraxella bovoculi TaxID=386891 RepID=UPI00072F53E1|nr:hypothetical protein [Moraxella bovoculi]AKG15695.2 hypothetical protein AAX08_06995 [Moraxella bovoculi]
MAISAEMKERYFRRQALYWFALAVAMLAAWFILWLVSSAPKIIKDTKDEQATEVVADLPTRIDALGELDKEVPPIDFSTLVMDLRTYPAEFKDRNYFNSKNYAIELMDVSQNEIIVNYLDSRPNDRNKFAYFRYLDSNQNPRYILTYGKFDSMEAARAANQAMDFDLPGSVVPNAVSMSGYLDIIDDYERGEVVQDLSSRQPRQVKLRATRNEIPVQAATRADEELANKSREQVLEKVQQIQTSIDKPVTIVTDVKLPKENAQSEPKAQPQQKPKAEKEPVAASSPSKAPEKEVPTPMVNTSKVPGSE